MRNILNELVNGRIRVVVVVMVVEMSSICLWLIMFLSFVNVGMMSVDSISCVFLS